MGITLDSDRTGPRTKEPRAYDELEVRVFCSVKSRFSFLQDLTAFSPTKHTYPNLPFGTKPFSRVFT
ncbi:hypothetical protein L2E82_06634 [Cichorium intybus]|uniref:Uncharacterized protein n=1 Tax=Cichorium intybus TaxID=13427 RepID=A0ACB9HBV4_CICIN|nr:hypothetical protein L2E82_06634 [Cichorium intybus]